MNDRDRLGPSILVGNECGLPFAAAHSIKVAIGRVVLQKLSNRNVMLTPSM